MEARSGSIELGGYTQPSLCSNVSELYTSGKALSKHKWLRCGMSQVVVDADDSDVLDRPKEGDEEEVIPFRYSISSYGADYPVDGLVQRLRAGSIFVPSFQRGFVWTLPQASQFVESLLLGLPVPGIFLSKEEKTQKLLVIDGQQRLKTLQFFYDGLW